ncbi:hypothetical protein RB195_006614 [Necator americanus]|uniref:Reverse transcriptase domain-containing protein n=1 Tax=Necator americanus TaxID=51031 RepID=A0ABR1BX90_NECAM
MLRRRDRRLLQDSKVISTDHVIAQHHLLVMDLKISRPRKRHPRTETQRIKWWNLKDRKEIFFASVAPSALPHPTRSVEEMWSSTSSVIRLTAENTLGKTTLGHVSLKILPFLSYSSLDLILPAYLATKREVKRAVCKAKSDGYKTVYDMLDTREGERAVELSGAVLRRPGQILERWREYYNHLYNEEFCHPPIPTVPSVEGGRTPDVWQTSVTVPVWKGKGNIAVCTSYRPIRLLCHTMKVFECVLEARLRKIVSVSLNQCGFVKDCSTVDAIHAVRILLEKHREKNHSVHLAFLDLEKGFDRVPHGL